MTYADTIKMTPEELRNHPGVELCACSHPHGMHKSNGSCEGIDKNWCNCTEFAATGLRLRNSLAVLLPEEPQAKTDYDKQVLSKIWSIIADGERALNPDADPEYDTNDLYDRVREGVEAKKKLAEGEKQIKQFLEGRMEEAVDKFDVTLKVVSDAVEGCARMVAEFDDFVYREVPYAGSVVDERPSMERLAEKIRRGK